MLLDQLPAELLLGIGGYLTPTSVALLCFHNKHLRSTFVGQLSGIEITSLVLLWAAEVDDTETMKLALDYRADVNYTNGADRTPLCFVAGHGNVEMTRRLLEAKDVDIYQPSHDTPLDCASRRGHATVVELLVAADVKNDASYILQALAEATNLSHAEIVEKLLVTAGKAPGFRNLGGRLLCRAAQGGVEKIVGLFLAAKIDHNACISYDRSALYLASGDHGGVMKLLIAAGADVNMSDCEGYTPLMRAVQTRYKTGVEILLKAKGIDINARDVRGETALSLAEQGEDAGIVELLYAAG
jgi:ankyrin repeat protein